MPDGSAAKPWGSVEFNKMIDSKTVRVGRINLLQRKWPILAVLMGISAAAQTTAPATGASSPVAPASSAGTAPSEALQRQALGPYRMILRSAAIPSKPRAAPASAAATSSTTTAAVPRQNTAKPPVEPSPPASPTTAPQTAQAAVTPIATPSVQAVEVPAPEAEVTTPPAPMTVAALTSPPPTPAAVAAKTALVLIKSDPPTLSGPLARESPSGIVRVAFNVNPDGSTSDFKIAASNNRRLNSAVVAAVTKWRYQPIDAVQTTEVEMVFSAD